MTTVDPEEVIAQWKERCATLNAKLAEAEAKVSGDADLLHQRLQSRCERQRKALDRLNRKVLSQRFRLNLLKSLGRDVTYDEYMAAKGENDRIDDYAVV